jgi:diguanylate cyclase (GGDEF)-like protein
MGMSSAAEERDQAGEQRDHDGEWRDHVADQRDDAGEQRDEAAGQRDRYAVRRDMAADNRDKAADERDRAAERFEAGTREEAGDEALIRSALARSEAASDRRCASQDRRAGARERTKAGDDRGTSLADRGAGACERSESEHDRSTALANRGASAEEREEAAIDDLTGAYLRGAGFMELKRDMERATRDEEPLVLAFIDVDGLKAVNDAGGHAAGDRVLLEVADAVRARTRSHDLLIRYGGDEFVCVIAGMTTTEATSRFAGVNASLATAPGHGSVTVGLAQMRRSDSPCDLVARADAALYRERGQQRTK